MKLVLLSFLLFVSLVMYAQGDSIGKEGFFFHIGASKPSNTTASFNRWSTNYRSSNDTTRTVGFYMSFLVMNNKKDLGVNFSLGPSCWLASFYGGYLWTPKSSLIQSVFNLEAGYYERKVYNIIPPGYQVVTINQHKTMFLRYTDLFVGIASKNFVLIPVSNQHNGGKVDVGLEIEGEFTPWTAKWKYGYYAGSGKARTFNGSRVYGIPDPGRFFINTSIYVGFGMLER